MAKKVTVLMADGFEEIEAVTAIDVLRRAGLEVKVTGVGKREIQSARGLKVVCDEVLAETEELPDAVVLPGGGVGAGNLGRSKAVARLLAGMNQAGRWVCAICASPAVVLAPQGLLDGRKATCYPGCEKNFGPKTVFSKERVVVDGHFITSRAPGTAMDFALEIAGKLAGPDAVPRLKEAMLAG